MMMRIRFVQCLVMVCCAVLLAMPAAAAVVVWDNGPINGTIGNMDISSVPPGVFDSFTVPNTTPLLGLSFGAWLQPNAVLQNVAVEIWTLPGQQGTQIFSADLGFTQSNCSTNAMGSAVCLESISFQGVPNVAILPAGKLWLTIYNATVSSGSAGWDINNGAGCTSLGCPSQAVDGFDNTVQSESFQIQGGLGISTPEPSSLLLLGTGVVGLVGALRRKIIF